MRVNRNTGWTLLLLWGAGGLITAAQAQSNTEPVHEYRALVNRYCATCHNERLRTADLLLDQANVEQAGEDAAVWERAVRKLRARQMPPSGAPRPDQETLDGFITYLETGLDQAAAANPNPGPSVAHRINRAEYTNAVRDLLGVEVNGSEILPADDSGLGFDNLAELLTVSPLLMDRYMSAAGRISQIAIGDTSIPPTAETYRVSRFMVQDRRTSEDLPFGTRGGLAVRHRFPLDGEYTIAVRLQRTGDGYIRGMSGEAQQIDVLMDGKRMTRFTAGGIHKGSSGPLYPRNGTYYRGHPEQIDYEFNGDNNFNYRFSITAGSRLLGVAFAEQTTEQEGIYTPPVMYADIEDFKGGKSAIESVTITGPYEPRGPGETLSREKIFVCYPASQPGEAPCAKRILSDLARRAYRRPVTDADVEPLLHLYQSGYEQGGFENGISTALQGVLVSSGFLFRIERDPQGAEPGRAYPVSDVELASRISFFLWSSIPDEELLSLASQGRLRDPAILDGQIRRMLADPRSRGLVDNFAGQWLYLRNLEQVSPDPRVFPEFDDNLREGFRTETELLFTSMLREDRGVLELLTADYTYVNERLARHYGIPNVYGGHFRRVRVEDANRRGLLGQGSILTVTSRANRTSPVVRGKWFLENVLGTPPPPPPADVPPLQEKGGGVEALTMRERMDQHRASPACASCHKIMDPIGFAMDNFNAIGQWREQDAGQPIDALGILPDGTEFYGPEGFRELLLSNPEQFIHTVTEKLLTYALGRETDYYDGPVIRRIQRNAAPSDYRWSSLITEIIKSTPFQMRRSEQT